MKDKKKKDLLKYIKKYYDHYKSNNFSPHYDTPFYLATYSGGSIGYELLKRLIGLPSKYLSNFIVILKDLFFSMNYSKYKVFSNNTSIANDKIIITWAFQKNFKSDGSLEDRYLNINSKKVKKTLWFVIYLDKQLPKRLKNNIVIYQPIKQKQFNIFVPLKILICNLKNLIKDKDYFLVKLSNYNFFSKKISFVLKSYLSSNIKKILILYEGQPFQNEIVRVCKLKHKIQTIGYVHAPPVAFPSNYIKKKFSPDKIFLNGKDQYKLFRSIGWNKNELKISPSLRFIKEKKDFQKKIYLPINFDSAKKIINNLEFVLKNFHLDSYKVQMHPASLKSQKNISLKEEILNLILSNKGKKNQISCPIFIGATGSLIEALESNCKKVMHITEKDLIEKYTSDIWESLKVKKIKNNVYLYEIKKKGNLLKIGKKQKNLNIFFKK